jgi:hypothetical protein
VSYVAYLGQFFYPVGLVIVYLRPGLNLPHWWSLGAFLVLGGITAAVLLWRRTCPYLRSVDLILDRATRIGGSCFGADCL